MQVIPVIQATVCFCLISSTVMITCIVFPSPPAGPWFIGELIDGHSGACFAFGVFIDGHFLEGSLTYVVGVIQVRKFL